MTHNTAGTYNDSHKNGVTSGSQSPASNRKRILRISSNENNKVKSIKYCRACSGSSLRIGSNENNRVKSQRHKPVVPPKKHTQQKGGKRVRIKNKSSTENEYDQLDVTSSSNSDSSDSSSSMSSSRTSRASKSVSASNSKRSHPLRKQSARQIKKQSRSHKRQNSKKINILEKKEQVEKQIRENFAAAVK